jgi:hypothetical protein
MAQPAHPFTETGEVLANVAAGAGRFDGRAGRFGGRHHGAFSICNIMLADYV